MRPTIDFVQAAKRVGANYREGFEVNGDCVSFDKTAGLWSVTSADGETVKVGMALSHNKHAMRKIT